MKTIDPESLLGIASFSDLLAWMGDRDGLGWPVESDKFDEITFEWTGKELKVSESSSNRLKDGSVHQLRPLTDNQPWGVFFAEFADGKIYRTALREILRKLVPNRKSES